MQCYMLQYSTWVNIVFHHCAPLIWYNFYLISEGVLAKYCLL